MKGFLISLVPSIGALFLLWVTLRAIFQADRRERAAMARLEAADRARSGRGEDPLAHAAVPGAAGAGPGGGRPAPEGPEVAADVEAADGSRRDG